MQIKLMLRPDDALIARAKLWADVRGVSLSQAVAELFAQLPGNPQAPLQPWTRQLVGVAGGAASDDGVRAYVVTTLCCLLEREVDGARARSLLGHLLERLTVAAVTDAGVRAAIVGPLADFEAGVTLAAAAEVDAAVIVTRNVRDFRGASILAVTPGLSQRCP